LLAASHHYIALDTVHRRLVGQLMLAGHTASKSTIGRVAPHVQV